MEFLADLFDGYDILDRRTYSTVIACYIRACFQNTIFQNIKKLLIKSKWSDIISYSF